MLKHWKKLALLVSVTAVATCVLLALSSPEPEPSYQGRKLSEWLLGAPSPQAESAALLAIGTNALPCLVNWACSPPPKWRQSIAQFCVDHPKIVPERLTASVGKRFFLYNATRDAFSLLDTNACPALPQLSLAVANTSNEAGALGAYMAIHAILRGSFLKASLSARADSRTIRLVLEQAFQHPNPLVREAATNAHRFGLRHNWPQ